MPAEVRSGKTTGIGKQASRGYAEMKSRPVGGVASMGRIAFKRREFLAGLGIAAVGAEVARTAFAASTGNPAKGRRIIRTVLKDIDPREISGATLMHEHLGLGRRPNRQPVEAPIESPTEDAAWMEVELKTARSAGVGCIV